MQHTKGNVSKRFTANIHSAQIAFLLAALLLLTVILPTIASAAPSAYSAVSEAAASAQGNGLTLCNPYSMAHASYLPVSEPRQTQLDAILAYGRARIGSTNYNGYCQLFVRECYQAAGLIAGYNAPSAATAWEWWGISTSTDNIPIGACLYFDTSSSYDHVGIYTGNGKMLHAVSTVREETISTYFWSVFMGWGFQTGTQPSGSQYEHGAAEASYTLSSNTTLPGINSLAVGQGFSIKGTVYCDYKLDYIAVRIVDENDVAIQSASASVSAFSAGLSRFDSDILFGRLPQGRYRYQIIASSVIDEERILADRRFNVGHYDMPPIELFASQEGGDVSFSWTSVPNTGAYALSVFEGETLIVTHSFTDGTLSHLITLPAGVYTAVITAESNLFWDDFASASIEIAVEEYYPQWDWSVSGLTYPQMNQLAAGQSFGLRGIIESNHLLTYVRLSVTDEHGSQFLTASAAPNAYAYNIYALDRFMTFGALPIGRYTYEIYVECESGESAVLHSNRFNVGYSPLPAPTVLVLVRASSVSLGQSPSIIFYWRASSSVEIYSVAVYNNDGRVVFSTECVGGMVTVSNLPAGTYTAVVTAHDARFWQSEASTSVVFTVTAPKKMIKRSDIAPL